MKCLDCSRLDLQQFPAHARVGMGRCALETLPGVFESWRIERNCQSFSAAPADISEKRIEWAEKLKTKS
jgi:hypothetical protein